MPRHTSPLRRLRASRSGRVPALGVGVQDRESFLIGSLRALEIAARID